MKSREDEAVSQKKERCETGKTRQGGWIGRMLGELSSEVLRTGFGTQSQVYKRTIADLRTLWKQARHNEDANRRFDSWRESLKAVYGSTSDEDLFIRHSYLATLAKLVLCLGIETKPTLDDWWVREAIGGKLLHSHGIFSSFDDDPFSWVLCSETTDHAMKPLSELARALAGYSFPGVEGDLFREVYEDVVGKSDRHRAGEYYTPEWLVQRVLSETLRLWEGNHKGIPRLLDPACGSGVFICSAIQLFRKGLDRLGVEPSGQLDTILENTAGVDLNPLACVLAKTNYIAALGGLVKKGVTIHLPIHSSDALKLPRGELGDFDIVVGNPPWIVMRSIGDKVYQDYLKGETLRYRLLDKHDVHLFTQMEIATLFFSKCTDLYLRKGGIVGFVMPRSVIAGTIHHTSFRRFETPPMQLKRVIDLDDVRPLFHMPSCVLIAAKDGRTTYPVAAERYSGEFPDRNPRPEQADMLLSTKSYLYSPPEFPAKSSYYFDKFKVGASIFPRTLYFVDLSSEKGEYLAVRTSKAIFETAKANWKVELRGEIEPEFLYTTLLALDIIPFGYTRLRPIVLPVVPSHNAYRVVSPSHLKANGFAGVARWFKEAQLIWEERRTEKSKERFPALEDRLDYNGLLTSQHPETRYIVLYNATGSNIVSCVVDRELQTSTKPSKRNAGSGGFVADVKTWFYETNKEMEAYYLSAVLNSETINTIMKPLQPRGLYGPRAIHRRPLLFPIPRFDGDREEHARLAEIAKRCSREAKQLSMNGGGVSRTSIKSRLGSYLEEINSLVQFLLA